MNLIEKTDAGCLADLHSEAGPIPLSTIHLRHYLKQTAKKKRDLQNFVILCIGTDRIIGDSLGPLVGSMLSQADTESRLPIYGTLQHTVHALNLADTADLIRTRHPDTTLIAVDAALGLSEQIGSVFVRPGCLQPGSGVHKNLPQMGDISITGIVGEQSRHPYLTLQTVRLSTVIRMAETICECILHTCNKNTVLF